MKLDFYFARRFFRALMSVTAIFSLLILMTETLELIRQFSDADLSAAQLLGLALLRLPSTLYEILPIVVVIATLVMYLGLARSSELVVARASGRSALRSLLAPVTVALLFGAFCVGVLNPISATTARNFETREATLKNGEQRVFSVSGEGLWLREGNADGQTVIRASRSNLSGSRLFDVTFLGFQPDGQPSYRIEAEAAHIEAENWQLYNAKSWPLTGSTNPEADAEVHEMLALPTSLSVEEIQDRFGAPEAVDIWDTQSYIAKLEAAGFSARAYKMRFQSELALPLTFVAMVLIGAGFTMRHTRLGRTSTLVLMAIMLAFGFYFLRSFAIILGQNGELPILLASWAPPLAVVLASLSLLLHLEDG